MQATLFWKPCKEPYLGVLQALKLAISWEGFNNYIQKKTNLTHGVAARKLTQINDAENSKTGKC